MGRSPFIAELPLTFVTSTCFPVLKNLNEANVDGRAFAKTKKAQVAPNSAMWHLSQ